MKNPIIFYISFLPIAMYACKKEQVAAPSSPTVFMTFAKEGLAFAQLPLNRFFIYKDSATGNLDSVAVTTSDLSAVVVPEGDFSSSPGFLGAISFTHHPAFSYQKFKLILTKLNGSQTSWYNVSAANWNYGVTIKPNSSGALSCVGYDSYMPSNSSMSGLGFVYSSVNPDTLQSLSVDGTTYISVLKRITTNGRDIDSAQQWYYKSIYYWAKGVGIIKRTGHTSTGTTTSNLIRYGG